MLLCVCSRVRCEYCLDLIPAPSCVFIVLPQTFNIPVVARLPKLNVALSVSELNFGCCPVGEVSKATLRVENSGRL